VERKVIKFFFCSFQNKSDTSAALAALFGMIMMYEYGDSLEETVFKKNEELNAIQKFDYISLVQKNKEKILGMYERNKDLLADE
jgi:hypothetical protein